MDFKRLFYLLTCILLCGALHAEDGCPDGLQPSGGPDGSVVCAPIPAQPRKQEPQTLDVEPLDLDLPPALFAAFAVDSGMLPYFSVDYPTRETAEAAALQSCREAGRPGCRVLGTFGTGCGTFAFDPEGKIFSGVDGTMPSVAAVRAMENCNAGSTTGGCMLVSKSICAGLPLSKAVFNDVSRQTIEDIEEISSMIDQRSYWGAFASDGAKISGSHGLSTEKDSETAALKQCGGCQIVISFKNSCGAIAWPADNRQRYEVDSDVLPAEARKKALVKCEGKYGACRVSVRCSGRSYREADPYANTKAAVSQPNAPAGPTTSDGTDAPGTRIPRNKNVSANSARH